MIGLNGRVLTSARLTYSLLDGNDASALRVLLSDPAVTEPAGFRAARSDEEFEEFFAGLTAMDTAVGIRLEGELIGYIHVYPERAEGTPFAGRTCVGFGFVIGRPWQGRGYGTEALMTLSDYMLSAGGPLPGGGRAQVDCCFADHFIGNEASRRAIEKAGYRYLETYDLFFEALGREMTCRSYVRERN